MARRGSGRVRRAGPPRVGRGIAVAAVAANCTGLDPEWGDSSGRGDDTAAGEAVEEVPGEEGLDYLEGPAPALCSIEVDCDAEIPDEPKIDCRMRVVAGDGHVDYDGVAGIERRGRSSYLAPKPQYGVELRDDSGRERPVRLLGMSEDADWVLNGNYYDRSLFRNKLAFDVFLGMGRYAPRSMFCTLTLNGEARGIYSLVERIKRNPERLALAADDGSGSSFLLKLDEDDILYENAGGYAGWSVRYPKPEAVDEAVAAGITATLDAWYGPMLSEDSADWAGAFDVVDRGELVDIVLLEEFAKNNDAFYLSLHAFRDGGGAVAGGRVGFVPWDMDLSFGQPSYNDNENPESWIAYRPALPANLGAAAADDLAARWSELRAGPLSDARVEALLDRYHETLAPGIDENFAIWPIESIDFGGYLYPVSSYEEEEATVRAWIAARLAWMDAHVGAWAER